MKKLTAGIFTVMMGLVAANSADAAVASKGYVDEVAKANTTLITNLTQTVETNATTAANATAAVAKDLADYEASNDAAVKAAQDAADAAQGAADAAQSDVNALETTVGTLPEGAASVVAYINTKTEGIATNAALGELQAQVTENTGDIATLTGSGEGSVSKAIADAVAGMSADGGAVKQNADAIAALEALVGETSVESQITAATTDMATNASVAEDIAGAIEEANLSQYETVEGALAKYEQISKLKALAYKDTVGTADIDDKAVTTAKLADGAVDATKLGANAVTNAAVADGALSQDKINGLDTTLATKMSITNATSETGKYVFTANVGEDGVTDYAWELIERGETTAE